MPNFMLLFLGLAAQPDIGGYLLIEADSIEDAAEIAKGAPHIELGGTTIVRPCIGPGA